MPMSMGNFFGTAGVAMFPSSIFLGIALTAIVVYIMLKIDAPMPFTIMVGLTLFAILGGLSTFEGTLAGIYPAAYAPFAILAFVIAGGVVGYAIWRMLRV